MSPVSYHPPLRLEFGVRLRVQIAAHDVGAAHPQTAAFGHAFHRLEFVFDARQKPPRRSVARIEPGVDGDDRAAFGRPVTFQHPRAKLPRPGIGRGFLQFLRARDQHAQGAEIIRVRLARVAVEKGVGAEKNRAIQIVEAASE
jgi:hypothetical protein